MGEEMDRNWQALSEEVLSGMKEWRLAHPKATFREIEQAGEERVNRLKARLLQDGAQDQSGQGLDAGARAAAAQVSRVWDNAPGAWNAHPAALSNRRARRHARAQLWNVSDLWSRAFSPLMRSWP
jgi:hypothetical protein